MSDKPLPAPALSPARHAWALTAGRAWADFVRASLRRQGRSPSGGWPGTVSEARMRASAVLSGQGPVLPEEQAGLALLLYDAARKSWLENREPSAHESYEADGSD